MENAEIRATAISPGLIATELEDSSGDEDIHLAWLNDDLILQ